MEGADQHLDPFDISFDPAEFGLDPDNIGPDQLGRALDLDQAVVGIDHRQNDYQGGDRFDYCSPGPIKDPGEDCCHQFEKGHGFCFGGGRYMSTIMGHNRLIVEVLTLKVLAICASTS
jgi:hypothetical protein